MIRFDYMILNVQCQKKVVGIRKNMAKMQISKHFQKI